MFKSKISIFSLLFLVIGNIILCLKIEFGLLGVIPIIIGLTLSTVIKTKWWKKAILIFVGILLMIITSSIGMYNRGNKSLEEIHFSENFSGQVRILYDTECGLTPEKQGKWDVVKIDTTDVLIIKRFGRRIFTFTKFYQIDKNGNKTELSEITDANQYKGGTTVLIHNSGRYSDFKNTNIQDYTLIKNKNDLATKKESEILNSKAYKKIQNCKNK